MKEHNDTKTILPFEKEAWQEREFRAALNQKLRTPLNAIIGFAELVAMRPGGATKDPDVGQWTGLCAQWLKKRGFAK